MIVDDTIDTQENIVTPAAYDPENDPFYQGAPIGKLPNLVCVGYVKEFGEVKTSQSDSAYSVLPFELEGLKGSRGFKTQLLYYPHWFGTGFNPREEWPEGKGPGHFVYKSKISGGRSRTSWLQGLCGSDQNWLAFNANRHKLGANPTQEQVAAYVTGMIMKVFDCPQVFYIATQRKDDGELTDQYQVDSIRYLNEANRDSLLRLVKSQPSRWQLGFSG